jgi:ABC-type multidrug transport system fused ATPase/permease subunit
MQAREVKRLDAILRSHVYTHFAETLTGLTTIRAYRKQAEFSRINESTLDVMNRALFVTIITQNWLGVRLDFVGGVLICVVACLVVTSRVSVSPSTSGLVLAYCIQVILTMEQTTRQFAEVENNMNATERIHHYAIAIESEAPSEIPENRPPDSWPQTGELIIRDAVMRYRDDLPTVLNGLSLHIKGGERIGIGTYI